MEPKIGRKYHLRDDGDDECWGSVGDEDFDIKTETRKYAGAGTFGSNGAKVQQIFELCKFLGRKSEDLK